MIKQVLFVAMLLVALLATAADASPRKSTIHLKSGEYVTGVITARDDQTVEIVTDDGMKYVYVMTEVDYISHEARKKNYDTSHFRGFVDVGYSLGVGSSRNNYWLIETSFGYQFNAHYYLGAGIGLHNIKARVDTYPLRNDLAVPEHNDPQWDFPFVPVYVEGRYNLRSETQGTPWASLKVGANTFNHSGFFASPSLGWHFAASQYFSFNIGIGYALHTASYKLWCTGDTPGAIPDKSGHSYLDKTGVFHNVFAKVGVEF
ncbi:MAG: hypothetical protein IJ613_05325 [Muribaculaceae bacterium]|nr:hypothetical protein [Muribaculaceae bacterium]